MGITGLLSFISAASRPASASEFSGQTVAVDAYCWLHRGAFGCADRLATQIHTDQYVKYCMKYVYMLLSHDIKPILVFDGRHLPAKLQTEQKRRESRTLAKKMAAEMLRMGKVNEAKKHMQRCVDITHEMASELIKECRKINVDCIVAPYEADAQLAYLNKKNVAQIVITEDSDLLLFGCDKILFKMDLNGNGSLVESSKLPLVMNCPPERYTFDKFRQMCILSGCDYLQSLPGIGLANARKFVNATRDPDICNAIKKLPSFLNKRNIQVTEEYLDGFAKAEATFKHQYVFDPFTRTMIPLNPLEDEGTDPKHCSNAGVILEENIAFQIAVGNLDPFTLKQTDTWNPDDRSELKTNNKWTQSSIAPHKSIWNLDYLQNCKNTKIKKDKFVTAFTKPAVRLRKSVTVNTIENNETGLTIETLQSMYCEEPKSKKMKLVIVPETQDFDDIPCFSETHRSKSDNDLSFENKDQILHSNSTENSTSPVLKINRNYRKFRKCVSSSKLEKLSRFQRTVLDEKVSIQSKFFSTDVDISCDGRSSCELSETTNEISENSLTDSNIENSELDLKIAEPSSQSHNNLNRSRNPFKVIDEHNKPNGEAQEKTESQPESSIVVDEDVKEDIITIDLDNIKKPSLEKPNINSRKISCRASGLRKNNTISKSQSVLTVFGFQKKCKLQH